MLQRLLNTDTFLTAQGALDGLSARHSAIADNISNVNTPGYKRKEVPFEEALTRAVRDQLSPCTGASCGPQHPFTPQMVRDSQTAARADGNNVDIESEMVHLAETTLRTALAKSKEFEDVLGEATTLLHLGAVLDARGNKTGALDQLRRAERVSEPKHPHSAQIHVFLPRTSTDIDEARSGFH